MNEPIPDNIRPIYGGMVDTPKLCINGEEVTTAIFETYRGVFDCESGILRIERSDEE